MAKVFRIVNGKVKEVESSGCDACGNTSGRFRIVGRKKYCVGKCARNHVQASAKNLWDFETMNISADPNQGPIKVKSLRHLRQLEREHGVVSVVANMEEKNWERR